MTLQTPTPPVRSRSVHRRAGLAVSRSVVVEAPVVPGDGEVDGIVRSLPAPSSSHGRAVRWGFAAIGVLCVALGAVGVFVPGLPTTIFLIIASWCFAKGCPLLERRLLRNRFFGPYMKYVDGDAPMPMRARMLSIAMVLVFSCLSLWWMSSGEGSPLWARAAVVAAALTGVVFIARYRRG